MFHLALRAPAERYVLGGCPVIRNMRHNAADLGGVVIDYSPIDLCRLNPYQVVHDFPGRKFEKVIATYWENAQQVSIQFTMC